VVCGDYRVLFFCQILRFIIVSHPGYYRLNLNVFWGVAVCYRVRRFRRFEGLYFLNMRGQAVREVARCQSLFAPPSPPISPVLRYKTILWKFVWGPSECDTFFTTRKPSVILLLVHVLCSSEKALQETSSVSTVIINRL
jgi:hypothetical protein